MNSIQNSQIQMPRATSEIDDHSNALQNEIDILHENLTTLENILLPVTKPYAGTDKQSSGPSVGAVEEALSPVGDRIRVARRQLSSFNDRINSLKSKLAI